MGSIFVKAFVLVLALSLCSACGNSPKVIASTPEPTDKPESAVIQAPQGAMPVTFEEVSWLPGMYGGDTGKMLAAAIADQGAVMMILGRGLRSAQSEEEIFSMIKAVSPKTEVVARSTSTLDTIMEERGEIPYRTTLKPGGTDILGRPFLLPVDHFIQTEWLSKKQAMKGADALITVQEVSIDERRSRRLRGNTRGGCKDLLANLGTTRDNAEHYFEPYQKAIDKSLDSHFAHQLAAAIPFWREELESSRGSFSQNSEEARCIDAFDSFIARYETCRPDRCDEGPFLFLGDQAGPVIGIDDSPTLSIPDVCTGMERVRDYTAEVRELAGRAAIEAVASDSGQWTSELARFAELTSVTQGMRDVCAVAHRRISTQDLTGAQSDLKTFLTSLPGENITGKWIPAGGKARVVGLGPITIIARLNNKDAAGPTSASNLIDKMHNMDKCTGSGNRVLQTSMVEVGSSTVVFMGLFFEAQLLCDGMIPSLP